MVGEYSQWELNPTDQSRREADAIDFGAVFVIPGAWGKRSAVWYLKGLRASRSTSSCGM